MLSRSSRRALLAAVTTLGAFAGTASAQPQFRSATTTASPSTRSVVLGTPAATAPGDLLVASVQLRLGAGARVAAPAGWRLVRRDQGSSRAPLSTLTFVRVASGDEPRTHVWRLPARTTAAGIVAAYSGVDTRSPVRGHAMLRTGRRFPQLVFARSVEARQGDLVVAIVGTSGSGRIAPPAGMTERAERGAGSRTLALHVELADGWTNAASAFAARAASPNVSNVGITLTLAAAAPGLQSPSGVASPPVNVPSSSNSSSTNTTTTTSTAPKADFSIAAATGTLSVTQGSAASTKVTVSPQNGFTGTVTLAAAGLPSGVSATYAPTTITRSGTATLTLSATSAATVGTKTITLRGSSGGTVRTATVALTVAAAPAPPPPPPPTEPPPTEPPPPTTPPATGTSGALVPVAMPQSTGATFYVATTGADTNPGTAAAPWRTVQKAMNTLTAGQIALVRAGTYTERLTMTRSGTATAPITIRNYPAERPVIQAATGLTDNHVLQLAGAGYVRIQGLTLQGASGPSSANIYAYGSAHDIELSYLEVRNSARQGYFSDRTTARIQIRSSHFHDNGGQGPVQRDHNIYIEGTGHLIASSLIRNAPNGYGVQIYPSNTNITVVANTITANGRNGLLIGSDGSTTTTGARVVGNIVTGNGENGIATYWGGPAGSNNLVSDNLVWGNAGGQVSVSGVTVQNTIGLNPLFVNSAAADFRLQATSPALNRNVADYTPGVDLNGTIRPQGGAPDLGAFEQ